MRRHTRRDYLSMLSSTVLACEGVARPHVDMVTSALLACRAVARPHIELEICIKHIPYKCVQTTVPTITLLYFLQPSVNMQT